MRKSFHVQQIALLGFSDHLMPRPVFTRQQSCTKTRELLMDALPTVLPGRGFITALGLTDKVVKELVSVGLLAWSLDLKGVIHFLSQSCMKTKNEEHTHSKKLSCKKYLLFFTSVVKKFLIWNINTYVLAKPFYCPNQRTEGECIINC